MRKLLPVLALVLFLFSCKKDKTEPKPETEQRYYLTSITRTFSNSSDVHTHKFSYIPIIQIFLN